MTEEEGFGVDRSKTSGRKSHCKTCDRERAKAYYAEHRDELYARREAVREAAWQAHLKKLNKEHRRTRGKRAAHLCTFNVNQPLRPLRYGADLPWRRLGQERGHEINDVPIDESERRIFGPRPDEERSQEFPLR
jgi:hypothetical protein